MTLVHNILGDTHSAMVQSPLLPWVEGEPPHADKGIFLVQTNDNTGFALVFSQRINYQRRDRLTGLKTTIKKSTFHWSTIDLDEIVDDGVIVRHIRIGVVSESLFSDLMD